jgi:GNAT superfamily N-acetyltransferase
MALSTFWVTDTNNELTPLPGFEARPAANFLELAAVNKISLLEGSARRQSGHRPYIAYIDGQPAGYGWVATREASIGELSLTFSLPAGHRYLWDFATLPSFRGRGVYPRLLQSIIKQEQPEGHYFWIIHAPENLPSGTGIDRAGFEPVGQLSFRLDGGIGIQPFKNLMRARVGAELLGIPLIDGILSPCWCCGGVSAHRCGVDEAETCWPPLRPEDVKPCSCAVAVQPSERVQSRS